MTRPSSEPDSRRRAVLAVAILALVLMALAGCSAGFVISADEAVPAADLAVSRASSLVEGEAKTLGGAAVEAPLDADLPVSEPMADAAGVPATEQASIVDDALIVRTGYLELEAADVSLVLIRARDEIGTVGGYVAGSDVYDQGEQRWASVVYRVPVERFDDAIDALRGLADRVVRESTQSQEVTAQVVDLDARIDNLRASEAALVEIMGRAGRIDDVLSVQMRLEDVRRQIEQLTAQRDDLSGRAALATITASWMTPVAAVAIAQEGWDFATEVDAALAQTVAALQGLASLLVWVAVVGLPLVGLPLLVALVALLVIRRRTIRRGDGGPSGPPAIAGSTAE